MATSCLAFLPFRGNSRGVTKKFQRYRLTSDADGAEIQHNVAAVCRFAVVQARTETRNQHHLIDLARNTRIGGAGNNPISNRLSLGVNGSIKRETHVEARRRKRAEIFQISGLNEM